MEAEEQRAGQAEEFATRGSERITEVLKTPAGLIRECLRRGIRDDEYDLAIIEPLEAPPWEPEEIESLGPQHLEEYSSQT
jgi:hypothetical protein